MEESTTREKVLKKIRAALLNNSASAHPRIDHEANIFAQSDQDPLLEFSDQLTACGGRLILCNDDLEFVEGIIKLSDQYKWKNFYCIEENLSSLLTNCDFPYFNDVQKLPDADIVIASCECMIARTGTIVFSSLLNSRLATALASTLIVFAKADQIVYEMKDAIQLLKHRYSKFPSCFTFSSGASRVSNIAGETITGAHGIQQLYVFLVDDSSTS